VRRAFPRWWRYDTNRVQIRFIALATAFSALAGALIASAAADPVLLVSSRNGWIQAIDLETLDTVSRVRVPAMAERVASDPSGRWLFVTFPKSPKEGCCALFALDPLSMQLHFLVAPALSATITADRIFTQRGNVGIEVFDSQNLSRLPTAKAPSIYLFRASPDGRRIFGITNWPEPSLDLFDGERGAMIASRTVPGESSLAGTWLGQQYYLFTMQSRQAKVRTVSLESGELGQPMYLSSPGSFSDCSLTPYDVIASGTKLAIFAQFGLKSDGACASPGGFVVVDPVNGVVTGRFQSEMSFRQIVASPDGKYLYGLDVGSPAWQRVRIVKMAAANGQVVAEKSMESGVWYLTAGWIPHEMEGRMDLEAIASGTSAATWSME
jgi:hypothetical protein